MAVNALEAHYGYLLRMVSNAVSHAFARKVASEGVTVAEWVMLRALYGSEGLSPTELASKMGLTKGAISKLAERLVRKALVRREARAGDRRGQSLSLTPDGSSKVPVLAGLADRNDAEFFSVLSGEELGALRDLLGALVERNDLAAPPLD